MNVRLAGAVLQALAAQGVWEFVVCAGARNAPFVKWLATARGPRVHFFFDERAAAFFALGRARRDGRPVAVLTTSGTAVAELLPAAVEAHYAGVPLVLVTADRPHPFRGSGAPQAIEQAGLFGPYAALAFDIDAPAGVPALRVAAAAPTHVNVAFDEPLLDAPAEPPWQPTAAPWRPTAPAPAGDTAERCARFLARARRPLVIVGALPEAVRESVLRVLLQWSATVHAEALSGLRECAALGLLRSHGAPTPAAFRRHFDAVLRIGGVPTLRLWRDLEDTLADVPVLSISERPFSGLARERCLPCGFEVLGSALADARFACDPAWLAEDSARQRELEARLARLPGSEPGIVRRLAAGLPPGSLVMLGNSLPIREWGLAAPFDDRGFSVVGNRGANGIDGLVATFLGLARPGVENWLVLGDLSALYDLGALAFTAAAAPGAVLRVVVVNNRGGRIFEPMFGDAAFVNAHRLDFSGWARMFGWAYRCWDGALADAPWPDAAALPRGPTVIELCPDAAATAAWRAADGGSG
jgi:2-succinyl-5-enolpyruvyl-6-hydroxy-3-cyclohexene-1-carboxylate synthase